LTYGPVLVSIFEIVVINSKKSKAFDLPVRAAAIIGINKKCTDAIIFIKLITQV